MKYLTALIITIFSVSTLNAGVWATFTGFNMKEVKPTAVYTINAKGYNTRVYEWTTKDGYKCIAIFGNDKAAVSMQCFKK